MKLFFFLCMFFTISCQTVTIKPYGGIYRYNSDYASYDKSQSFFLLGLVGERFVDVSRICGDRKVMQMQTQATFLDQLVGVITFGIYTPRTARVWCKNR